MDDIDKQLITQLQEDGRKSYVEMVKQMGVSERTVRNRLNKLLTSGAIKIAAIPNLEAFSFDFICIVAMQLQLGSLEETAKKLMSCKNICLLVRITGRYDLIAIIAARTIKEYGDIMDKIFTECKGVLRTETFSNVHAYKGEIGGLETKQLMSSLDFPPSKKARR